MKRPYQKNRGLVLQIRINPEYIWYVNAIFEGYEGLAVVRTIDKKKGILELLSTKDQLEEIRELLKALSEEMPLILLKGI